MPLFGRCFVLSRGVEVLRVEFKRISLKEAERQQHPWGAQNMSCGASLANLALGPHVLCEFSPMPGFAQLDLPSVSL